MSTRAYAAQGDAVLARLIAQARAFPGARFSFALVDQAASSGATFLTGVIVARSCSKADFGAFALSLIVVAWCTNVQSALITTPFIYAYPSLDERQRREQAFSTFVAQLLYSAVVTATFYVAALIAEHGAPHYLSPSAREISVILGMTIFCLLLKEYCRQVAYAILCIRSAMALNVAVGVLQIAGLALLARADLLTLRSGYWWMAASYVVPSIAWLVLHHDAFSARATDVTRAMQSHYSFGRWLLGGYVLNAASRDSFPWLLSAVSGAAAAGTLSAATSVASLVTPVVTGISNVLGPTFSRTVISGGVHAVERRTAAASQVAAVCAVCYCVAVLALGGRLVAAIYGGRYAGVGPLVTVVALSVASTIVSMPTGVALYALGRADVNFRAARAAVVAVVLIGAPLVASFGALGAAVGLACGTTADAMYKIIRFRELCSARAACACNPQLASHK